MAITFVGQGAEAYGTGNLSVGVPSGIQEGDLLIVVTTGKDSTMVLPGGWTTIRKQETITVAYHHSFYKFAGASESAVTVTEGMGSVYNYAKMFAYRGVDPTTPVLGIGGGYYNQPSNSISALGGTTTAVNGAVVIWAGGWWWNSGSNTANNVQGSTSGLTNFAEVWDYHRKGNATNSEGLFYYHGWKDTAGASGSNTLTWTSNLAQGNWGVWYLKPYVAALPGTGFLQFFI